MLEVRHTSSTQSYEERMKQLDTGFEEILNEICVLNVQWINDKDRKPNQLRRRDLCPQARGWLDFVKRSLNPTSNTSEVTLERTVLIYSIMKGENINVGEMITANIHRVLKSTKDSTRLTFPSIIQRLCDEAGVEKVIDEILVEQDKPITAKKMEKVVVINPLQRAREYRAMCKNHKGHHNKRKHMFKDHFHNCQHQFHSFKHNFWKALIGKKCKGTSTKCKGTSTICKKTSLNLGSSKNNGSKCKRVSSNSKGVWSM
ncbi:hypothetical protein AHAS_Ahas19G0195800 [Arachis hypogaea]